MNQSYWQRFLHRRMSRRGAMAATGATAIGAAFLAACGGDDDGGDSSSLVSKPVDTTNQAMRGGTLTRTVNSDPPTLDPHGGGPTAAGLREFVFSRFFRYEPGVLEPSTGKIAPDVAESWEWATDGLTLTIRMRPDVKFHNLPPVNGRAMDLEDITYTWERFSAQSANRNLLANSVNPGAPVLSVTTPGARTVVFKFKEPLVYVENFLGHRGLLNLVPKESRDLDLRQRMLGSGPFLLSNYQPSVALTFQRHEGYWDRSRPYIDQVTYPVLGEYSQILAQFRVGALLEGPISQSDVLSLKRDLPQINLFEGDLDTESRRTIFGWQDTNLRDERVRQALSMSIDRDTWLDAQYNTDIFSAQGLKVTKRWHTAVECGDQNAGWWLDPQGKDFGENAKYYQLNVAEAKKLLAAAGHANGLEITSNHITTGENGAGYVDFISTFESMAGEAGFTFKKNIITYDNYFNNYRTAQGKFNGLSYKLGPINPSGNALGGLVYEFSPIGGVGFHGFDAARTGDGSGDPHVEAELKKATSNFDVEARRKIVHDLQRYLAKTMYNIRWPGGATSFNVAWPALRNYRVFRAGDQQENLINLTNWWIDSSQPPNA
ncbi:MAG: hypothetical protein GEU75_17440 [Dehalococcoidia bacterium]|nr:hypothetical protein [Dehalococcoidia bacterium]